MPSTLERILEEASTLSDAERVRLGEILIKGQPIAPAHPNQGVIDQVRGKYAWTSNTSDDFIQRKTAEIEIENRRFEPDPSDGR
ncbi:MAG: hypothetical protein ABI824_01415 [Acidobacteriota bacterium]